MTRNRAIELDNDLKEHLQNCAKEYDVDEAVGIYIVDHFVEFIPEDSMKGVLFLGANSASYKIGNVRIDLKRALVNAIEYAASISKPESVFNVIQLLLVSVLFLGRTVKQEIDSLEAYIVYFLHTGDVYRRGIEEERFILEFQKWYQSKRGKTAERGEVMDAIEHLCTIKVMNIEDGNIFLVERVWGSME